MACFGYTTPVDSILLYKELAKKQKDTNANQAIRTIEKAVHLAVQHKQNSLLVDCKNSLSLYYLMIGDYKQSEEVIGSIIDSFAHSKFMTGVMLNRLGYNALMQQKYVDAAKHFHQALDIFPEKNFRHIGITHTYLTNLHTKQRNFEAALKHIEIALDNLSRSKRKQYYTMALTELGLLYYEIEDYTQAKSEFQKALEQKIDNLQFKILPYVYLGLIEHEQHNHQTSKEYLLKADSLSVLTGNVMEHSKILRYLSQISYVGKNYEEAVDLAMKAKQISDQRNLELESMEASLLISKLNLAKGNAKTSIENGLEVLKFATDNNNHELEYKASDQLATIFALLGEFEKSYKYRTQHQSAKDNFSKAQNLIEVTGKTTKFKLEQERRYDQKEAREEIEQQRFILNIGLVVSILLAIFSLFSYFMNAKRKRANAELSSKNDKLRIAEKDLEFLNLKLNQKNDELKEYINVNLQLENFAHIASHDLKAPLREQASFIQLLEKECLLSLAEKERNYLSIISKCNSDIQTLIEDMIEYSFIKSDAYKFSEIDPTRIIKKAEYLNRDLIHQEGATIIINEMPKSISGDAKKLTVAFRNLIHNSLIYKRENIKPVIEIGGQEQDGKIIFWVKDNGLGIHPNFRFDVFDVFKRLTNTSIIPGNGLGLAVVKHVAEKHNGQVWLESETAKGSTFYFSIAA